MRHPFLEKKYCVDKKHSRINANDSKALSYGFLVYNSYQAYKSATANDPVIRAYITKNFAKSKLHYDQDLGKTFSAGLKSEVGKSSSALLRQASRYLSQSDYYLNTYRGISSVVGSALSFWNIAR